MKLLVVTPYFYPEGGGLERYAYNIFKRLVDKYEITVYCATKKGYDHTENFDGMTINRLKPDLMVFNTPIRFNLYKILYKELTTRRYDLINGHTPVTYFAEVAALVSYKLKIPYILTFHCADMASTKPLPNIISKILSITVERFVFSKAVKIITVNDLVKEDYLSKYGNKVEVITPGVDTSRYIPPPHKVYNRKLLFIGPLSPSYEFKGLRVLLKAMPQVINSYPDTTLTIIGDGPLKNEFVNICKSYGIEGNVIFRGRVSEDDLIKSYQEATILIVPSTGKIDSFTIVSIEANACGTPVIASKVGGIPYYVKDGINGFIVRPRDDIALAEKIINLLDNKELLHELSIKSRKRAEDFDWNKSAYLTKILFDSIYNMYHY